VSSEKVHRRVDSYVENLKNWFLENPEELNQLLGIAGKGYKASHLRADLRASKPIANAGQQMDDRPIKSFNGIMRSLALEMIDDAAAQAQKQRKGGR
jgi:hypothetical protein